MNLIPTDMAHYIDADTLRVKITDLCANANFYQQKAIEESDREDFVSSGGEIYAYAKVLSLLDSLQQEQPSFPSNLDEAAEEWVRPIMRTPSKAQEYLYTYLLDAFKKGAEWMAQVEQEVDLEKEYQEFCKDYPFPWSSQYVNREYIDELCLSVARHFYELGRKAKEDK